MNKKKIVILIPALNPTEDFIEYIDKLSDSHENIDIVVVDDGSREKCKNVFEKIAKLKNTIVLTHAINLGKGRALKTGFNYYINNYSKENSIGIITADSDGQHDIGDIIAIGKKLKNNTLILGTRDFNEEQVPFKSRSGNKITTVVFKLLYGKKINDTQTGLRGLSYDFAKECIKMDGERFEYEINMLIEAVRNKVEIVEHKIKTIYFDNNSETHFNPVKDSIKIYGVMLKRFLRFFISGITSSILDIGLFTIFYNIFKHNFTTTVTILIATILARVCSSMYNYIINKNLVFNDNKKRNTIIKYYILCIIQMLISWLLVNKVYIVINEIISPSIVKIFVDVVLFLISFQIQQRWVFAKKGDEK